MFARGRYLQPKATFKSRSKKTTILKCVYFFTFIREERLCYGLSAC